MSEVIALYGRTEGRDRARCRAVAGFFRRRAQLWEEGGPATGSGAAEAVLRLAGEGLLSFEDAGGRIEAHYTPSRRSLEALGGGPEDEPTFPAAVDKKHRKALRRSPGALFRFPAEDGDGRLDVFITDWSPCPVAAAVAVHPDHPFLAGQDKAAPPFFTGRFVRHPLTGDLLPVWVAGWVKPDFGTGAVLVNPAHDPTDLEFARRVGLTVRFGLVPEGFDGSAETWPDPPVVRTGRTIRTGPYDGLGVEEARDRYFDVLQGRELASRWTDLQAGRWRIAALVPDPAGELRWDARTRRLTAGSGPGGESVRLETTEVLDAATAIEPAPAPVLTVSATERTGDLLALRLLHHDLAGRELRPAEVHLIQKVQGGGPVPDVPVEELALLVGAPLEQVLAIKRQTVEQCERFLRVHGELDGLADGGEDAADDSAPPSRRLLDACQGVLRGDPARVFVTAYQLQKDLAKGGSGAASDRTGYLALRWLLAGHDEPVPDGARDTWSRASELLADRG